MNIKKYTNLKIHKVEILKIKIKIVIVILILIIIILILILIIIIIIITTMKQKLASNMHPNVHQKIYYALRILITYFGVSDIGIQDLITERKLSTIFRSILVVR